MATPIQMEVEGTGHNLLCLHGLGGGGHWFKGLSQRLREHYQIVTLDLPGTGRNRNGFSPFTAQNCVSALSQLIATLPRPLTLVGQSMGTILALKLQAQWPGRFHSLIFVGGLPEITPTIRQRLSDRRSRVLETGLQGLGLPAARGVFAQATFQTAPYLIQTFAAEFEAQPVDEYVEGIDILLSTSAVADVAMATIPCLIVSGSEDTYAPPLEIQKFVDVMPGTVDTREFKHCGHMVFLENTEVFSENIKDFIGSSQP